MKTKRSSKLTLKDKLSRLTYRQACSLLGAEGERLIKRGGAFEVDIDAQVRLTSRRFGLALADGATVSLRLSDGARSRLRFECDRCQGACEHVGAASSLVLEEKLALGLSTERPEKTPLGLLTDEEAIARALADREQRAAEEKMEVRSNDPDEVWTDYTVLNRSSGRSYRVALRGMDAGDAFCTCPDFRRNGLGTCKHVIRVRKAVRKRFTAKQRSAPYLRKT